MKTVGNVVLITGGATGIGLALAEAFVTAGNEVVVCGRRESRLKQAKDKVPKIGTMACDISEAAGRQALFDYVTSRHEGLNILVNNAGIQRMIDLKKGISPILTGEDEIEVNLRVPALLSALFIPVLIKRKEAAIVNVSSGLAFIPLAAMPIYCASKAGLHSFCLSLRYQLRDTSIRVFEVIPPMVDTELDKGARQGSGQLDRGIPASDVARVAMTGLENDEYEIMVGAAKNLVAGSRKDPDGLFRNMNHS